jgi:transcription antitermination factor NusG
VISGLKSNRRGVVEDVEAPQAFIVRDDIDNTLVSSTLQGKIYTHEICQFSSHPDALEKYTPQQSPAIYVNDHVKVVSGPLTSRRGKVVKELSSNDIFSICNDVDGSLVSMNL